MFAYYLVLAPNSAGKFEAVGAISSKGGIPVTIQADVARHALRLRETVPIEVHPALGFVAERIALDLIERRNADDSRWKTWCVVNYQGPN